MSISLPTLPELHIDLDALNANYLWFKAQSSPAETAAAVKANAYGLGLDIVGPALLETGCKTFFVAHLGEGIQLRNLLGSKPVIYGLHGPTMSQIEAYSEYDIQPVLNAPEQVQMWQREASHKPAALHVDTGINRLGLCPIELEKLDTTTLDLSLIMSHLACAATPDHPLNARQIARFTNIRDQFPHIPASLCNTAGILLGDDYHFNLTRPGIGLYGGSARDRHFPGPELAPVARLLAPILQIRDLAKGDAVGYGATFIAPHPMQIALIAYGYADGLSRHIGPDSMAHLDGHRVPLLGRVSMDLMAVDITMLSVQPKIGDFVTFLGDDLNDFATSCEAEPYEILTSIGPRVKRVVRE